MGKDFDYIVYGKAGSGHSLRRKNSIGLHYTADTLEAATVWLVQQRLERPELQQSVVIVKVAYDRYGSREARGEVMLRVGDGKAWWE